MHPPALTLVLSQGRGDQYATLSQRLRQLAQGVTPPRSTAPLSTSRLSTEQTPETTPIASLTITLERRGETLHLDYHLPAGVSYAATRPWHEVQARLSPLDTWCQHPTQPVPNAAGQALFDVLFGTETAWEPLLRSLFRQPAPALRPNPIRAGVRLRLCTQEPFLLGLPWRLLAWQHYPLAAYGWLCLTTPRLEPTESYTTTAPCTMLLVALGDEGQALTPDPTHGQAILDVLQHVWPTGQAPGYVRTVHTRQALENALQGLRPHGIYVYGTATSQAGAVQCPFADGSSLRLSHLADLLRQAAPAVLYLNVAGLGETAAMLPILHANVPLVLWSRLPTWQPEAASFAVAWLRQWLQACQDPVQAWHDVSQRDDVSQRAASPAVTPLVHGAYRAWHTQRFVRTSVQDRLPHLRLNRDEQKALVAKHVRELCDSDARRVMALVAYAGAGNLLHALHEQLRSTLEVATLDVAEINWRHLAFPQVRDRLLTDLAAEMSLQLNADTSEPLAHVLRRHAPQVLGTGKRGVVWLNWGTFGPAATHTPLKPSELSAWLRFSSEILGDACPEDLRLVSYAALEVEPGRHQRLHEELRNLRREPWSRRRAFRLTVLPPLGDVAEDHLFDFFVDGHSRCDANIQDEISQRLIVKTSGRFEAIAALMREAEEHGSWYDLLGQLRREQGVPSGERDDDEPF